MSDAAIGFGSGISRGLANVFAQDRQNTITREREREDRDRQNAVVLIDHLFKSGRVQDYADLEPLMDVALGLRGGKKGQNTKTHQMLAAALAPTFGGGSGGTGTGPDPDRILGAPPSGSEAPSPPAPGQPPSTVSSTGEITGLAPQPGAADAAPPQATPSPGAAPPGATRPLETSLGGIRLRTDEGMAEAAIELEQRKYEAQAKRAREIYESFKDVDKDFTLRDAMRAAGFDVDVYRGSRGSGSISQFGSFGAYLAQKQAEKAQAGDPSPLTSDEILAGRTEFYAANRSMGVNREALARAEYGAAFAELTPEQQQAVIKREVALIGDQSYARGYNTTAATEQAQFAAPIDATTAKATNLPVGTSAADVAGQTILTDAEQKVVSSLGGVADTIRDIRNRLVPAALPKTSELTGTLTAGPAYQYRKRVTHTKEIAALESAVANTVNALARAREQSGAQTEPDIRRAEQALVTIQTSLLNGDTIETAQARIDESLKILEEVTARLPKQATPVTPPGGGTRPPRPGGLDPSRPFNDLTDAGRRNRARQALLSAPGGPYEATDATIDQFLRQNPTFK